LVDGVYRVESPLRISEIHYNPPPATAAERAAFPGVDNDDFEFLELTNIGNRPVRLGDYTLGGGVDFRFDNSSVEQLAPGERVVVVSNVDAFRTRYGTDIPIAGAYSGRLSNSGDRITLTDRFGYVVHDFAYDDEGDWPELADGRGSSLVAVDTDGDYGRPDNWQAGHPWGGSPGTDDLASMGGVLISEVFVGSGSTGEPAWVELYNSAAASVDVSGWWLSASVNNLAGHVLPQHTAIGFGEYLVVTLPAAAGFPSSGTAGGELRLVEMGDGGEVLRFADHVRFDAAAGGSSLGRWPGVAAEGNLFSMLRPTPGAPNAGPVTPEIVLSEIHYQPAIAETRRDDFSQDSSTVLQPVLGDWSIVEGRYQVVPGDEGDTAALLSAPLTNDYRARVTLEIPAESTALSNGALLFDYHGPNDFKFVSLHAGNGRWRMGRRDDAGWHFLIDLQLPVRTDTDYALTLEIRGSVAILRFGHEQRIRFDFAEPLGDGQFGLGSKGGQARFDNLEIEMLGDAGRFEFVEVTNTADRTMELSGWTLSGGIEFTMPSGLELAPGESLLVVGFDPSDPALEDEFRRMLAVDSSVRLLGPYAGDLADAGDTVRLLRPLSGGSAVPGLALVDRLRYRAATPWPNEAAGQGASLGRLSPEAFGNLASSWHGGAPSPGDALFARSGDMNLDGIVDVSDITALVLGLSDEAAYQSRYGLPPLLAGDADQDGDLDYDDIESFVSLLSAPPADRVVEGVFSSWDAEDAEKG
jgi:hypothetical protein